MEAKRRGKTRKGSEKAPIEEDRISDLPNPLLLHILSFLSTKLAARTSVLSQKWRYLWTCIPILDFDTSRDVRYYHRNDCLNKVVSFINRSLILNRSPKFEKFRVHFNYKNAFASDVDVWLCYSTMMNVEELDLNFSPPMVQVHSSVYNNSSFTKVEEDVVDDDYIDDDYIDDDYYIPTRYRLPMNTFSNNSSLVILRLKDCDIKHRRLISWKSLKVLSLTSVNLTDDFIREMLLGSPSLELLELHDCLKYQSLDINSQRLRKVVISKGESRPLLLKISAPRLQSLDVSGFLHKYSLINLSSLIDAKLNFYQNSTSDFNKNRASYTMIFVEHLEKLENVEDLTVTSWCLQVLSMTEEKALPCPLYRLVCLRVNTNLGEKELPGIARLLQHAPLIETLVINMTSVSSNSMCSETEILKFHDLGRENYWSSQKSSFLLALQNIKTVRIVDFIATKCEIELLLFMLKNASMLEKMIIHPENSILVSLKKSAHVTQTLLSFPRCSPEAVVLFS